MVKSRRSPGRVREFLRAPLTLPGKLTREGSVIGSAQSKEKDVVVRGRPMPLANYTALPPTRQRLAKKTSASFRFLSQFSSFGEVNQG